MPRELLLCVNSPIEVELVETLAECPEFKVIRRCVDEVELTSVALAGVGEYAVILPTEQTLLPELALALIETGVVPILWGEASYSVPGVECVESLRVDDLLERLLIVAHGRERRAQEKDCPEEECSTDVDNAAADRANAGETETAVPAPVVAQKPLPPPPPPKTEVTAAAKESALTAAPPQGCAPTPHLETRITGTAEEELVAIVSPDSATAQNTVTQQTLRRRKKWNGFLRKKNTESAKLQQLTEQIGATSGAGGRIIAVTGTFGGPGRSTLALALARVYAQHQRTTLVDADNYAPAMLETIGLQPPHLNLLDFISSKEAQLLGGAISENLEFIAGIPGAHRWREARPEAVIERLTQLRAEGSTVIVDLAAFAPASTAITYGPDRDAFAREICAAADQVILVGRGDTVGIVRLTRLLNLTQFVRDQPLVVVNQVSVAASGKGVDRSIRDVMARAGCTQITILHFDDEIPRSVLYRRDWESETSNRVALLRLALAAVK